MILYDFEKAYEPEIYKNFGINKNNISYLVDPESLAEYMKSLIEVCSIVEDKKLKDTITNVMLYRLSKKKYS